jgi:hypothetical protein
MPQYKFEALGVLPSSPGALLGIELEYEGTKSSPRYLRESYPKIFEWWVIGSDGSLRGEDACEIRSSVPMSVAHVEYCLPQLLELSSKWQVNKRTGLHVHLDVGHMTQDNLVNLLCLYGLLEPAVFTAAGDERSANPFSVPWYKDPYASKLIAVICGGGDAVWTSINLGGKYSALNFRPILEYGTVEFRHMKNTHNTSHIFGWISMILHMRNAAMSREFGEVFASTLETRNYRRLLAWVYGGDGNIWSRLLYPDLEEEIDILTWELAREYYYAVLPNTFLKLVNKKRRARKPKPNMFGINVEELQRALDNREADFRPFDLMQTQVEPMPLEPMPPEFDDVANGGN